MTVISWKDAHPDRDAQARQRRRNRLLSARVLRGRAGKDALMPVARAVASAGACAGWLQVLNAMERAGLDTALLRIWANAQDKDEIDRLCLRARRAAVRPARMPQREI